jgi:hypothetical protein
LLAVNTPEAIRLALQAIEDCTSHHKRCPSIRDHVLPTRLIDCDDPLRPKLVTTANHTGRYVALSYVWGEPQPHSTITRNIVSYQSGIGSSILPQTIKDAISLTHALGFRYLWADTLCIIQDSDDDKAQEIARMRAIFRDAHLVIVAASATKVSEGFLQDRLRSTPTDIALSFQLPNGQVGSFCLSIIWKNGDNPEDSLVKYNPSTEPINKRGWCLQEYVLAPRALVFASHTLQYHCQTSVINLGNAYHEQARNRRLPDIVFALDPDMNADKDQRPSLSTTTKEWLEIREGWFDALVDYTQRSVTVSNDKLVAFAGVAEQFYRVWGTPYLAGLWQETLFEDLFWHKRPGGSEDLPRPAQYRAPTWSWASVDGGVEAALKKWNASDERSGRCEILSCDVTLENPQIPFGRVTSGTLVLRAALVKSTWTPHERQNYVYAVIPPDTADDSAPSSSEQECIGTAWIDSMDDACLEEVWAVPLMWTKPIQMTGLVVALAHTSTANDTLPRYRRLGFLRTHAMAEELDWIDRFDPVEIVIE